MAVTNTTNTSLPTSIFNDTVNGATAIAVKASSSVVYEIVVDNSANGAAASYTKLWNTAAGSVTVGTTVPDMVVYAPAATKVTVLPVGGVTFGTALSCATLTAGGTAGTTPPVSSVIVTIAYT